MKENERWYDEKAPAWEVRDGDRRLAFGTQATFPRAEERKRFREHGYKIFADGKLVKN